MSQYPGTEPSWGGNQQDHPQQYPGYSGQQGYGQPAAPYAAPGYQQQPAYPAQPGYPTQQAYPSQPGSVRPGYPTPVPGYGYQPPAYPGAPASVAVAPNPVLGYASLAVVVLATIACLAGGWMLLQAVQELYLTSVYTRTPSSDELQTAMTGPFGVIGIASTAGFAGWVAGIVATATNRGRVAGILAIIVGALAPILTWGYVVLSLAALTQQYR